MKMMFAFKMTVEVDSDAYELAYGNAESPAALRADALDGATQHAFHTLNDHFNAHDAGYRLASFKGPDGREMTTE